MKRAMRIRRHRLAHSCAIFPGVLSIERNKDEVAQIVKCAMSARR
jgi:hypothetical protein